MPKRLGFGFLEDAVEAVVTGDVPKSSNKKIWIIVGVVVLILVGVLLYFLLRKSNFGNNLPPVINAVSIKNIPSGFTLITDPKNKNMFGLKNSTNMFLVSDGKTGFRVEPQPTYPFTISKDILNYKAKKLMYNGATFFI
jgi:hypothetical protein